MWTDHTRVITARTTKAMSTQRKHPMLRPKRFTMDRDNAYKNPCTALTVALTQNGEKCNKQANHQDH